MIYDIEVRPGPGMEFFQYYTESVNANSSDDALKRVQRSNPGCELCCTGYYNDDGESGGSGMDLGSSTTWALILVGGVAFFYLLPIIIGVGAIALVCWGGYKLIKWILK